MENTLNKYFEKLDKNFWVWEDSYLMKGGISGEYGYFTAATLHLPNKVYRNSNRLEDRMGKIILHRGFHEDTRLNIDSLIEGGYMETVYRGLMESDSDLEFLIKKLGLK